MHGYVLSVVFPVWFHCLRDVCFFLGDFGFVLGDCLLFLLSFSYEFHTSLADSCCCFVNDSWVHHLPHDADGVGLRHWSILGGWSIAWERSSESSLFTVISSTCCILF